MESERANKAVQQRHKLCLDGFVQTTPRAQFAPPSQLQDLTAETNKRPSVEFVLKRLEEKYCAPPDRKCLKRYRFV